MKNYRLYDEIGRVDTAFVEEVFEYTEESKRRHIMSKTVILKAAAIAACAAVVIGAGAAALMRRELPVKKEDPVQTAEVEPEDSTVVVERSYNERIADGEEVKIETHIGERIEHQGFAFTLKNITVSPTFPEGITKADISYTPTVAAYTDGGTDGMSYSEKFYSYREYAKEHGLPPIEEDEAYGDPETGEGAYTERDLFVSDVIDDNGMYNGPMDVPDEAYKWVFLELEIENLTDEDKLEYFGDMQVCYGDYITEPAYELYDKDGNAIVNIPEYSQYSIYSLVCYMSEHTDEKITDDRTDTFLNVSFAPSEKKSIILGYCISDHFIYGDLVLQLHNSEPIFYQSDYVYLPLK